MKRNNDEASFVLVGGCGIENVKNDIPIINNSFDNFMYINN